MQGFSDDVLASILDVLVQYYWKIQVYFYHVINCHHYTKLPKNLTLKPENSLFGFGCIVLK